MNTLTVSDFRKEITKFEDKMRGMPGVFDGSEYPVEHTFVPGMYIRKIFVPAGNMVVTKIHKLDHPCFIIKGDCSVISENGTVRLKAPHYMITKAGTKRVVYVHEDTEWVTVHATEEKDLDKIEEQVIAKSFEEFEKQGGIKCLGQR